MEVPSKVLNFHTFEASLNDKNFEAVAFAVFCQQPFEFARHAAEHAHHKCAWMEWCVSAAVLRVFPSMETINVPRLPWMTNMTDAALKEAANTLRIGVLFTGHEGAVLPEAAVMFMNRRHVKAVYSRTRMVPCFACVLSFVQDWYRCGLVFGGDPLRRRDMLVCDATAIHAWLDDVKTNETVVDRMLHLQLPLPGVPNVMMDCMGARLVDMNGDTCNAPPIFKTIRGSPGSGKFAATCAFARAQVRAGAAVLFVVKACALPYRAHCAAELFAQDGVDVLLIPTAQHFRSVTWSDAARARVIMVTDCALLHASTLMRRLVLVNGVLHDPARMQTILSAARTSSARVTAVAAALDAHAVIVDDDDAVEYGCCCAARLLETVLSAAREERRTWCDMITEPVLDVLPFAAVVSVDDAALPLFTPRTQRVIYTQTDWEKDLLLDVNPGVRTLAMPDTHVSPVLVSTVIPLTLREKMACEVEPTSLCALLKRKIDGAVFCGTADEMYSSAVEASGALLQHIEEQAAAAATAAADASNADDMQVYEVPPDVDISHFVQRVIEDIAQRLENAPETDSAASRQLCDMLGDVVTLHPRLRAAADSLTETNMCVICTTSKCNAMLPCGHVFCAPCVQRWLVTASRRACPTCMSGVGTAPLLVLESEAPVAEWDVGAPSPQRTALWQRVRRHDVAALTYFVVQTLAQVTASGGRAVVVASTAADARAMAKSIKHARELDGVGAADVRAVSTFHGNVASRHRTFCKFLDRKVHVVAALSDCVAGAGFPGVSDVIFVLPDASMDTLRSAELFASRFGQRSHALTVHVATVSR